MWNETVCKKTPSLCKKDYSTPLESLPIPIKKDIKPVCLKWNFVFHFKSQELHVKYMN